MKCMTTDEVKSVIKRIRQLNDTIQKMSKSAQCVVDSSAQKIKKQVESKMKAELNEVAQTVKVKLISPLALATAQLKKYRQIVNVPTAIAASDGREGCPATYAYLRKVSQIAYAVPIAQLTSFLASYAAPMQQLNAEIQKASSLTVQLSSNSGGTSQVKIKPTKVTK